jgi:predicted secreted protein
VHKKKCPEIMVTNNNDEINEKDLIMLLVKQNSELLEVIKNGTHNTMINNNSNNKTFNLQFFLNETCKDAMNIMDFVDSIKLQLSDLENFGEIGYVNGISNIIVKNLKELDITERPVHCTDKKREILYIKDENKWEKEDSENKKMRRVIKKVANKNIRLLQKFKEEHPDCGKSDSKYSDQYNKLIVEAMGGSGDNNTEKEDKIIKKIAKEVIIDK